MNFDDLRLASGTVIQLQFIDDSRKRFPSRLMGHLEGRSILVTHPVQDGRLLRIRNGQRVIARAMTNSAAVAFTSNVEALCSSPYPYLHLDYPEMISMNRIRRSPRIAVTMPVSMLVLSEIPRTAEKPARLVDISPTGARLEAGSLGLNIGDEISLTGKFRLSEMEKSVTLVGIIRARIASVAGDVTERASAPAVYGVEFQSITEEIRLFLHAFVYQQMLERTA
ncbi:MAG: flagellar brake protein [Gammaproteobacteria bacterium]|nr:flagellar brake protein [Gammaproteobacteria bacterium]MDP2141953.1 flagellar brake protein [Gammaproteobacteria bacterium]MDP2347165.1 flagellar brake protein [Gammaproteobacteria bacterium]